MLFLVCLVAVLLYVVWVGVMTVRSVRLERSGDHEAAGATRFKSLKGHLFMQWFLLLFALVIVVVAIATR